MDVCDTRKYTSLYRAVFILIDNIFLFFSIFIWSNDNQSFEVFRQFSTQEPCSCFQFTSNSLIVGAERFYKINLKNFTIQGKPFICLHFKINNCICSHFKIKYCILFTLKDKILYFVYTSR